MEKTKIKKEEIIDLSKKAIKYLDMFIEGSLDDLDLERLLTSSVVGKVLWDYLNDRLSNKNLEKELDEILGDRKIIVKGKLERLKNPLILKKVSISSGDSFVLATLRTNNNASFSCQISKDAIPFLMSFLLDAFVGNGNVTIAQNRWENIIGELKRLRSNIDELISYVEKEVKKIGTDKKPNAKT